MNLDTYIKELEKRNLLKPGIALGVIPLNVIKKRNIVNQYKKERQAGKPKHEAVKIVADSYKYSTKWVYHILNESGVK